MQQIRVGLEWFLNPDHVPFILGIEAGWFAEQGLEVTLVEPSQHDDSASALVAGSIELAITEPIHLLEDTARGLPLVGFQRFLHTNGGVMFLRGGPIARPSDLAGKRIQYPGAPSPLGAAIVRSLVRADGGPEGCAFESVDAGFAHTEALARHAADAATLCFYNFEILEARAQGLDADFFALKDWGVPDFCQLILTAHLPYWEAQRPAIARFTRVLQRGIDTVLQEPERAHTAWTAYSQRLGRPPVSRAIFDATARAFVHDPDLSEHYWQALGRWAVEQHVVPNLEKAAPDPAVIWQRLSLGP